MTRLTLAQMIGEILAVDTERLHKDIAAKKYASGKTPEDWELKDFELYDEAVKDSKVKCKNCGWIWDKADGGDDLYICHKCNHDNAPHALENFKDGKKKGKSRPGRVKKSGASCNGSVTDLRRKAKNASGEKAKMYHWCANMKNGKKK